jgi:hypothetical protein
VTNRDSIYARLTDDIVDVVDNVKTAHLRSSAATTFRRDNVNIVNNVRVSKTSLSPLTSAFSAIERQCSDLVSVADWQRVRHLRGTMERSSRQGRSLAGCKSPYRQLPVVGRLAYPMRGEVTNRVLLGRKSPGCPAGVFAAVGTIWGASKLGGRNITKYLQPRKSLPHEVVSSGIAAGSRPTFPVGKADGTVEETGASTRCTAGVGDPASKNRLLEITSGSCRGQQGLVTTCKDSPNEAKSRRRREPNGSGA